MQRCGTSKICAFSNDHNSVNSWSFSKDFFCVLGFSLRSTTVPNFIKIQDIWCNFEKKFAHLAWSDPYQNYFLKERLSIQWQNLMSSKNGPTTFLNSKR